MECKEWLKSYLTNGPLDYRWVKAEARQHKFTRGALKKARVELGVVTEHVSLAGNDETWYWRLPE